MFSFPETSVYQTAKCFASYGTMAHVEPGQRPSRGKPWNSILAQPINHKVDLILPEGGWELIQKELIEKRDAPSYYRVIMTLGQILDGVFFDEYIKTGNILMLSEGRTTEDNVFSLHEGKCLLTMYLDKESYERAGLVGKPYGAKGRRGLKPRWVVSYQLRDPSMLHGKKGFERLLYACRNALSQPVTWLFSNLGSTPAVDPLAKHAPVRFTSQHGAVPNSRLRAPSLAIPSDLVSGDRARIEEFATDLYEWLSLVRLQSPRVLADDDINDYLSRYQVPNDEGDVTEAPFSTVRWQGFLTADWVRQLFVDVLAVLPSKMPFALSATSFSKGTVGDSTEVTFLRPRNAPDHYFLWEVKGADL